MFAALAIVVVQSKRLDPGPQTFIERTPAVQNPQKRYATKEVVVYLTPSQIKAIQEGKGYISAEPVDQAEPAEEAAPEAEEQQPEQDDLFELSPEELEQSQEPQEEENEAAPAIPVEEPASEQIEDDPQFAWIFRQDDKNFVPSPEDPFAYLRYYPETETQTEQAQPEEEEEAEEETEEAQPEAQQEQQQRFRLVPFDSATEKPAPSTTKAPQEEPIRERWLRLLELNRSQLRKQLASQQTTTSTTEQPRPDAETTLGRFRFSARYNDQKQAIENEERRKIQLEKLRANIRAEGRGNRAPFIIRKDGSIARQRQSPLIKHVKVPTPVLVPIPEPFEVKVPHPFPVPLEIFRPLANQSGKAKKGDAKKVAAPARSENERPKTTATRRPTTTTTTTTTTSTERPSAPERRISSDNRKEVTVEVPTRQRGQPERITIIRHIWDK
ncbi:PREDICTED: RNA polymerase II degradation factor 1-like isoform X2 [Papilio polytes]|uniref:RNA polymerase II degradation factor 1-like isoform X2 n=1 Tax=Papilio polytes TaxID=76194 RepID=UPI000675F405|nr:PREDICTED: RNA polymerase II degradation factor 1-like isoform X2 [Papilio polytes]